jgi:hypothetical protein
MSTAWQDLRDETLAEVDEEFAEHVGLFFLKNGAADPDRPKIEIDAPLRTGEKAITDLSGGNLAAWKGEVAAAVGRLAINRATYSGPPIRRGDKVRALDRPGQPWFEVLFVDDRSHTRLVAVLGETGGSAA